MGITVLPHIWQVENFIFIHIYITLHSIPFCEFELKFIYFTNKLNK